MADLPWGHIRTILDKAASTEGRDWYAGRGRPTRLVRERPAEQDDDRSMKRTGTTPSNFACQLAAPDFELPQQVAKDPYNFEFLGLSGEVAERELEQALTSRITEPSGNSVPVSPARSGLPGPVHIGTVVDP